MLDALAIMYGGVLPALLAGLVLVAVQKGTGRADVAWLLGVSLGYVAGHLLLSAQGTGFSQAVSRLIQPTEAKDCLPLAVIAAAMIEAIARCGKRAARGAWLLRILACLLLPWVLLRGSVYLPVQQSAFSFETNAWSTEEAAKWLGASAGTIGLVWALARLSSSGGLVRLRTSLCSLAAFGATLTIALSGSITTAQLAGVLTASIVGAGIAAAVLKLDAGPEQAAAPILAVYGGVLIIARFLLVPELENSEAALLMAALAVAITPLGRIEQRAPRILGLGILGLAKAVVCLACLATVVVPAAREFAESQRQPESNPYGSYLE